MVWGRAVLAFTFLAQLLASCVAAPEDAMVVVAAAAADDDDDDDDGVRGKEE
jgi:hypothetical protein